MRKTCPIRSCLTLVLALGLGAVSQPALAGSMPTGAPSPGPAMTRTQMLNELNLQSAQVALDTAKAQRDRYERDYNNALDLFKKGIISNKELDDALTASTQALEQYQEAEIALEKTKLGFLASATHITVADAKKHYDRDGRRILSLTLTNASSLAQAGSALGVEGQSRDQVQALLNIENVIISVQDDSVCVGKPYEQIIPVLPYGKSTDLSFVLLKDVDETQVRIQYLDHESVETVYLEKESLQSAPTVTALQFSQEGQLGQSVDYDLNLEMLVTKETSFVLAVTNLPPEIQYSFVDVGSGARVSSVRFDEQVSKHDLRLGLSIPDKLEQHAVNKPLPFQVWVLDTRQAEQLATVRAQAPDWQMSRDQLAQLTGGRCDLVLIPQGVGQLDVLLDNFYAQAELGASVRMRTTVQNTGTLPLTNVRLDTVLPPGWKVDVSPQSISTLSPGSKQEVTITLDPGTGAVVGEYEAVVKASGQAGSASVASQDKTIRIRVVGRPNTLVTVAVAAIVLAMIGAVVVMGIKLSRR